MKHSLSEEQLLNLLMVGVAVYDYLTIPFYSLLITIVVGFVLYSLTKSQMMFICVLFAPQIIRFINNIILGKKESFITSNPQEVVENLKKMKKPTESFADLKEVSNRVVKLKEDSKVTKVEKLSGLVDPNGVMPLQEPIAFLEQFENRTDINENTRIMTFPEASVPAVGTIEKETRSVANVEGFDSVALNNALVRSMNTNMPTSSNLDSVEVNTH